jgi:hypothetical protein
MLLVLLQAAAQAEARASAAEQAQAAAQSKAQAAQAAAERVKGNQALVDRAGDEREAATRAAAERQAAQVRDWGRGDTLPVIERCHYPTWWNHGQSAGGPDSRVHCWRATLHTPDKAMRGFNSSLGKYGVASGEEQRRRAFSM